MGPRAAPIARGNVVYAVGNDAYAYALRRSDGTRIWRTWTGASNADLALCRDRILVESQAIVVLNPDDGRILATLFGEDPEDFTTSGIAVANGRAFATGPVAAYAFRC